MFNRFSLTRRFWAVVFVYWVVFSLAMLAGIVGQIQARDSLRAVHQNRMMAVELINNMMSNFHNTRLNILLAFQHDPQGSLYELHDHPVQIHLDVIQKNIQDNAKTQELLAAHDMDSDEKALFQTAMVAQAAWRNQLDQTVNQILANRFTPQVMQDFLVAGRTEGEANLAALRQLQQYQSTHANQEVILAEQRYEKMQILFLLIVLLGAVPVTWFMLLTLRRMTNGFSAVNDTAQAIAQGDLSRHIYPDGQDEITNLMTQIRVMQQNLRQLISRINTSSATLVSVANRVADSSLLLSDRTDQQAASLEETSAATEELNSTVHQNAANAREAETMADQASSVANRGGEAVQSVVRTMDEIKESSHRIFDIVGIIDSIAFQTNILALNAAVEAARAGEQGRGFAVVASEVRALAQRSAAAANEVKELVNSSVEVVGSGSGQVSEAGEMMTDIVTNNQRMMILIKEIAAASQEQSVGLNQINQAINLMDDMTHQNVSLVEQTTEAASALRAQADELVSYVSAFQIGNTLEADMAVNEVFADTPQIGTQRPRLEA